MQRNETLRNAETHLEGGQLVFLDQVIPMCQNQPTNVQVLEGFAQNKLRKKKVPWNNPYIDISIKR